MSTQTLNGVAIDALSQYRLAGKHLVEAYRLGTRRIVGQINDRYASALTTRSLPLVSEAIKASLIDAQRQISGLVDSGVAMASDRADQAIDWLANGAADGIKRVADTSARIEAAFASPAVEQVRKLNLPVAQMSLALAERLADGSKRLAERVATVAVVEAEAAAAPAAKSRTSRRVKKA